MAVVPHLWPPQYSTDENGQPAGFAIDVMEAVAAKAGLNVTYKIVDSFANAVSTLKNGDAEPNEDNGICLKVEDTGIGINEEDISKIILPFGQARDIFARNHEGTGLGLSLAKSLVELHEGTLEIKSQEGKGTTVIVKLPAGRG
ncbi:MAG: transporter substrate-binding domain-containing protein [Alphaproteobacteria bacterium]|nr:transporter substrate-binding domain-containing protein [Alphaproteobacteria bacterium]